MDLQKGRDRKQETRLSYYENMARKEDKNTLLHLCLHNCYNKMCRMVLYQNGAVKRQGQNTDKKTLQLRKHFRKERQEDYSASVAYKFSAVKCVVWYYTSMDLYKGRNRSRRHTRRLLYFITEIRWKNTIRLSYISCLTHFS